MEPSVPQRLPWDSAFFGISVGRAEWAGGDVDALTERSRAAGFDCVYLFVAGERVGAVEEAIRAGARLVDVRVELERRGDIPPAADGVRRATPADVEAVEAAAAELASQSRFSRDPRFPPERVDAMYRLWGGQCLRDGVVTVPGEPSAGLVGGRETNGTLDVELVWVAPETRARGAAAALVAELLRALPAPRATVATQAWNVPALRLYASLGFRPASVTNVLHLWP